MNWDTRYGYDISTYPDDFRVWMNENKAKGATLEAMQQKLDIQFNWDYIVMVGSTVETSF